MPQHFTKFCHDCGAPVKVSRREWKWGREMMEKYTGPENPAHGKAMCDSCQIARWEKNQLGVLYPVSVWQVTEQGFVHTLLDKDPS